MKKIIIINIILILILFFISEITSYFVLLSKYKDAIKIFNSITKRETILPLTYEKTLLETKENLLLGFRPTEERNEKKQPIVLFGCSFTEGFGLEENQTFSRKLADYTNRTIINRGKSGTGLNFLYLQLSDEDTRNNLPKNPEYIIYTLIPDHFPRLYRYRSFIIGKLSLKYKIKNNKLEEDKPIFVNLHSLFTSKIIEEYISDFKYWEDAEDFKLFNKIMDESYKIIKEHYKNTKFVILYYKGPFDTNTKDIDEALINYVSRNKDIILIEIDKELPELRKSKEYWLIDNDHPSEKAWDMIVPIIAKKLNINSVHH